MQHNLFEYYERELRSLKEAAAQWKQSRPNLAQAIDFESDIQVDPFVKRLVDSFAFLTARLQTKLDTELPDVASAMIETLLPLYARPVPAFGVVQFQDNSQFQAISGPLFADRKSEKPTSWGESFTAAGKNEKHVPNSTDKGESDRQYLELSLENDPSVEFRAVLDVCLWNLRVANCDYSRQFSDLPPAMRNDVDQKGYMSGIRLRIQAMGLSLQDALQLPKDSAQSGRAKRVLRFYMSDPDLQYELQAAIFDSRFGCQIALQSESGGVRWLPPGSAQEVGLSVGGTEFVVPAPATMPAGYRTIFELFAFPERYLFWDLEIPPDFNVGEKKSLDIFLFFTSTFERFRSLKADSIRLNCCPVVNLSEREPADLQLDHYSVDIPLDANHDSSDMEIFSIADVSVNSGESGNSGPSGNSQLAFHPFFTAQQHLEPTADSRFFYARRRGRQDEMGTDVDFSLVDATWNPFVKSKPCSIRTRMWVCNRRFLKKYDLSRNHQKGTRLTVRGAGPVVNAILLGSDWKPMQLPRDSNRALWNLIAILNLNHLLLNQVHAANTLKQLLTLLNPLPTTDFGSAGRQPSHPWIDAIANVFVEERVVGRVAAEPWGGFATGTRVTLQLDMNKIDLYQPGSYYILGRLVDQLLALQTSINTFVEVGLAAAPDTKPFLRFPKRCGHRRLI